MIRFRPLAFMTVFSVAALVVLMGLGRWQWDKYEAKRAAAHEPLPQVSLVQYKTAPGGVQFVYGVRSDTHEQGWRVFAPIRDGDEAIFVDSDFIPDEPPIEPPNPDEVRLSPALREDTPVRGISLRPRGPDNLTRALAPPRPLERLWFAIDLAAMGRNAGFDHVAEYYVAIPYVGADGRAQPNPFALAPGADALPPERHLGYALTWYGLALVLVGVYFAYHRSVGRLSFRGPRRPEGE